MTWCVFLIGIQWHSLIELAHIVTGLKLIWAQVNIRRNEAQKSYSSSSLKELSQAQICFNLKVWFKINGNRAHLRFKKFYVLYMWSGISNSWPLDQIYMLSYVCFGSIGLLTRIHQYKIEFITLNITSLKIFLI